MIRVVSQFTFEGFHRWPEAPEGHRYLASLHRHLFYVRVELPVGGENREVEIIELRRMVKDFIVAEWGTPAMLGDLSCESVACLLLNEFNLASCEVIEDGENGAKVTA